MTSDYQKPNTSIWVGRNDPEDGERGHRWHHKIEFIDLTAPIQKAHKPNSKVILGFASDEGVKRNLGRTGAANGPDHFRKYASSLAWHFNEDHALMDAGNVVCNDSDLEKAQRGLSESITKLLDCGYFPLTIGGGHEVAFASFSGLFHSQYGQKKKIGIINLDAHFDLRKPINGPTSGTPFFQAQQLNEKSGHAFRYLCLGIQEQGNTKALFDKANELGVVFLNMQEILQSPTNEVLTVIDRFIEKVDAVYFTICLDVFDSSFAPGVSAPCTNGLHVSMALEMISHIMQSGKVKLADIAELNPDYDIDGRTGRLAALLAYQICKQT